MICSSFPSRLLTTILVGLLESSAIAQQKSDDILVVGDSRNPTVVADALSQKISSKTDGQLARFQGFICMSLLGLPDKYAAVLKRSVLDEARSLRLTPAEKNCRPNFTVMFVKDAKELVSVLPGVSARARKLELGRGGPAYVFDRTEIKSRDGDVLSRAARPVGPATDRDIPFLQIRNVSIIERSTRQDLSSLLLIIDRSSIVGKSLRQVSGYVTMRGLARASDSYVVPGDSTILSLLKQPDEKAPESLTAFDRAYLKALYQGQGLRNGYIHGSELHRIATAKAEAQSKGEQ